ncbi:MAG: phosphatase PAP2 family protein [SAR86 cluster bacterium]|jgi:acid phosphatase (class A)|uniref:Acid phosphatase n=1 Tax=SAR86 cluster bacterium TaxID=2030880 RepID=A0A972W0N7_9GAMM|nr:phosphatase PAP2 family protein [SAR86 cluster bacterium]
MAQVIDLSRGGIGVFAGPGRARNILALLGLLLLTACSSKPYEPAPVDEIRPGILRGYLSVADLPDSLGLLPAPPALGSAAEAQDIWLSGIALTLQGSPRWALATQDAVYTFPEVAGTFSCAINAPINEIDTPHTYRVLRRSLVDAGYSTAVAKNHYKRPRPFMVNSQPTCTPDSELALRDNGSYPSGHTAFGWAWGLILSELVPERTNQIIKRGRAYGVSRMVCNVHWNSDVESGRTMAAATVARLHADPVFQLDMAAAKQELAELISRGLPPSRDCAVEAAALDFTPVL